MRTVRVPVAHGVRLDVHVREAQQPAAEPAFLLVHGLASNARLWDGVADRLVARGHTAAAVDQRGHGRSDKPDTGYDFETLTADLARVIGRLHLDRPVAVGQSWGGNVVLELAARHPELVRGVACIDGGTIELSQRFPDWATCAAALAPPPLVGTPLAALEARLRRSRPDWPERAIQATLACFEVRDDGTVAPWLTFERHMTILGELWGHRPSQRYREITVPVLLLPCEPGDDREGVSTRESVGQAAAALPRVRTHWFGADHDVHAQHPDAVAGVLLAAVDDGFFRSRAGATGNPGRPA